MPGKHEESLLWERIDADEMPPGEKKLSRDREGHDRRLDRPGARRRPVPSPTALAARAGADRGRAAFWSFQPIRRPEVPPREAAGGDADAGRRLPAGPARGAGLAFSPEADRRTLDPPGHVRPDRPAADARGGRRLRGRHRPRRLRDGWSTACSRSPAYGERWARHWLDVAGYADSDGDVAARTPSASTRASTATTSSGRSTPTSRWDDLIREQLAGDEMVTPPYADLSPGRRSTGSPRPASCARPRTAPATRRPTRRRRGTRWSPTRSRSSRPRCWA